MQRREMQQQQQQQQQRQAYYPRIHPVPLYQQPVPMQQQAHPRQMQFMMHMQPMHPQHVPMQQYQAAMQMPPPPAPPSVPVSMPVPMPVPVMPQTQAAMPMSEVPQPQQPARPAHDALDANSALWYQQLLDTNEELMQAIVENMHIGRFEDCVHHHKLLQANLVKLAQRADALSHGSTDPYFPLFDAEDCLHSVDLLEELEAHIQHKPEVVQGDGPRVEDVLQLMHQEALSNPASQADASLEPCAQCQLNNIPGVVCRKQLNHTNTEEDEQSQKEDISAYQNPVGAQFVMPAPVTQFTTLPAAMPAQQKRKYNKWSPEEEERLREALTLYKSTDWKNIAEFVGTRSRGQCRSRFRTLKEKSQRSMDPAGQVSESPKADAIVSDDSHGQLFVESHSFMDQNPATNNTLF